MPVSPAHCRSGRRRRSWCWSSSAVRRRTTFTRLLVVSAHGGNAEPVARAVERLRAEGRRRRSCIRRAGTASRTPVAPKRRCSLPWTRVGYSMHVAEPGDQRPLAVILPELRAGGVRAVSSNGVLGDPTRRQRRRGRGVAGQVDRRAGRAARYLDGQTAAASDAMTAPRRVAVVTGAARGIGAATVLELAATGWAVVAVDSRHR